MANRHDSLPHAKRTCKRRIVSTPKHGRKIVYDQYRKDVGEVLRTPCGRKGAEMIEGRSELCQDFGHKSPLLR